jgi:hypothetical protein
MENSRLHRFKRSHVKLLKSFEDQMAISIRRVIPAVVNMFPDFSKEMPLKNEANANPDLMIQLKTSIT